MDFSRLTNEELARVYGAEMGLSEQDAQLFIQTQGHPSMGRERAIADLTNRAETRQSMQRADFAIQRFAQHVA
jgi:hypothetical protein